MAVDSAKQPSVVSTLALIILFAGLAMLTACNVEKDKDALKSTGQSVLGSQQLAIVVNDNDPISIEIGEYYADKRQIPADNIVHVHFEPGKDEMSPKEFERIKADIDRQTPSTIQAYALTWNAPYKVGCMSITTAVAAGFNEDFCAMGCQPTMKSPYFDSNSIQPHADFSWRPTMMLAGENLASVKATIDGGVSADGTEPNGTAYLLSTSDKARNTRAKIFSNVDVLQAHRFKVKVVNGDTLTQRGDIMFYFTGLQFVDGIDNNIYQPGAIADHLTSFGGKLTGSSQMSSLRWLSAGATGSYGTVVEPCSFTQKFPRPDIVIERYLNGETLLEAYWKSVEWPGQGVFIGEPLAAPFRK